MFFIDNMVVTEKYCLFQEQNGTNGSASNGNGCPPRDPYEDLVGTGNNFDYDEKYSNELWHIMLPPVFCDHDGVSFRLTIDSLLA